PGTHHLAVGPEPVIHLIHLLGGRGIAVQRRHATRLLADLQPHRIGATLGAGNLRAIALGLHHCPPLGGGVGLVWLGGGCTGNGGAASTGSAPHDTGCMSSSSRTSLITFHLLRKAISCA